MVCEPFLKWPGGKRWLARTVAAFLKDHLDGRYYEPFLGGGAVFFALHPERATLTDINPHVISTYTQVRDNLEGVLDLLKEMRVEKRSYYHIRAEQGVDPTAQAARFLFLNRTCFGGMYRLNKHGEFNVPYGGGQRTPNILWERGILAEASAALRSARLMVSDFESVLEKCGCGDAAYCDPTYTVAHGDNGFVRYNEKNFAWADQIRLARVCKAAAARGSLVVISNACHQSVAELYAPFVPLELSRHSLVSRLGKGRREVKEYLFVLGNPRAFTKAAPLLSRQVVNRKLWTAT